VLYGISARLPKCLPILVRIRSKIAVQYIGLKYFTVIHPLYYQVTGRYVTYVRFAG